MLQLGLGSNATTSFGLFHGKEEELLKIFVTISDSPNAYFSLDFLIVKVMCTIMFSKVIQCCRHIYKNLKYTCTVVECCTITFLKNSLFSDQ